MFDWLRSLLEKGAKPIMKAGAPSDPLLKAEHWYEIKSKLRVGDVLITRTNSSAANGIIPGFYSHSAVYVGNFQGIFRAVDSSVPAVDDIDVLDLLMHIDHIAVMRAEGVSPSDRMKVANEARKLVGKSYDYSFRFDNDDFYCSEVVFKAFMEVDEAYRSLFDLVSDPLGYPLITPQSIRDGDQWECIFESPLK